MPATQRQDSPATQLRADAEALHGALTQLVRLYQFRDRDRICCHDVSVTQCNALEALVERGAMRSQALAGVLLLDKSTTTRVVDALVRKGYVVRRADPADARAVVLSATRSGRALYERINAELIGQQVELLQGLDPQVRTGAIELIRRLARAAEARFVPDGSGAACAPGCAPGAGGPCG